MCQLGEIKYCAPVDDGRDESDDEEMEDLSRPPSPVPSTSLRDRDEFCGLDLHQQLGHTKEVLQAVLNDSYPPVQSRHERFMRGGKERAALDKDASLKGVMTSREVSKLTKLLIRWVLRDSIKTGQMIEDCEVCGLSFNIRLCDSHPCLGGYGTRRDCRTCPPLGAPSFLVRWFGGFEPRF